MIEMRLLDFVHVRVGDMWPSRRLRMSGPIVDIYPQVPTEANGMSGEVAVFADGSETSVPDVILVSVDELLEWRRSRGDDMTQFCRHGMRGTCIDVAYHPAA